MSEGMLPVHDSQKRRRSHDVHRREAIKDLEIEMEVLYSSLTPECFVGYEWYDTFNEMYAHNQRRYKKITGRTYNPCGRFISFLSRIRRNRNI